MVGLSGVGYQGGVGRVSGEDSDVGGVRGGWYQQWLSGVGVMVGLSEVGVRFELSGLGVRGRLSWGGYRVGLRDGCKRWVSGVSCHE